VIDLLLGNSMDSVPPATENLPDAPAVAGTYVSLRRNEGNRNEATDFMFGSHMRIDAIDENMIALDTMGITINYRQTAPYVFRAVSADTIPARASVRSMYEVSPLSRHGIEFS
jgi:hypothetical protein